MTKECNVRARKIKKSRELPSPRQMIFCFMSLFSLALILRNSDVAIEYMSRGLRLCATTLIPSLFPFMVISELIVSSGAVSLLGKALRAPMRLLFGVSGEGGCAVLLGALCGFPIGAKAAVAVYDSGRMSKKELERVLTFSNNPSAAFMISAVGASLFGDRTLGFTLYGATLVSAATVRIGMNIASSKKVSPKEALPQITEPPREVKLRAADFTKAVTSSALGVLNVCAFVIFFTAFLGTLSSALSASALPPPLCAIIFGFFELTGGIAEAATLPHRTGAVVAAFISGWSGLSVHFQIMSICADRDVSFKPYFAAKLMQGALAAAIIFLFV